MAERSIRAAPCGTQSRSRVPRTMSGADIAAGSSPALSISWKRYLAAGIRMSRRGRAGTQTASGHEVEPAVADHLRKEVLKDAELLEDAERLVIDMRGARERVDVRLAIEHRDPQATPSEEARERRADRTESDDRDIDVWHQK